ncbi:MAG: hypothetical protein K0Q73_5150 [Paenibacillus sp.]|nr:hypothetical protein [Paenibacillus sp.]
MKRLKKKFAVLMLLSMFASVGLFTTSASAQEIWIYERLPGKGGYFHLHVRNEYGLFPLHVYRLAL